MRRAFEENLKQYKRIANADRQPPEEGTDPEDIATTLQWHISDAAKHRYSTTEAQKRIYELQKNKQQRVEQLHAAFRAIGTPDAHRIWPKGARKTTFENGTILFKSQPIDLATLITDAEWGVYYALPTDAPKHLQKQYLLGLAKLGISSLLNEQIIMDETSSARTDTLKKEAYTSLQEMDHEGSRFQRSGFIAETLVKNLLAKIALRFEIDFEIIPSDVFDDVENKIDFVIRRKNRYRGVTVEESAETPKNIGVQFTINKDPDVRIRKERQILSVLDKIRRRQAEAPIEDLVLVQLDMGNPKHMYEEWKRKGSPPGGPDDLWPIEFRERIYNGMMQDIYEQSELHAQLHIAAREARSRNQQKQHAKRARIENVEVLTTRPKNPFHQ